MSPAAAAGRFTAAFAARPAGSQPGVIPYVTAGFPDTGDTVSMLLACQRAGAIALEVGIPFSDPLADGPTVQRTGAMAIERGMTPALAISQVAQARQAGLVIPVAAMTYVNLVMSMGLERWCAACSQAGVDALIVPDLPADEAGELATSLRAHGLDHIPMVAPTTPTERLARVCATGAGFVYCVSVIGTTGARDRVSPQALDLLERVRGVTPLPRALGFGLSRPEHVAALHGHCEAVVVGSALLDAVQRDTGGDPAAVVEGFVRGLVGEPAARS